MCLVGFNPSSFGVLPEELESADINSVADVSGVCICISEGVCVGFIELLRTKGLGGGKRRKEVLSELKRS
jgi:hypothetical protein